MDAAWPVRRLTEVADVWFSGVDKKSHPEETPVRLCNYIDVIRNLYVTSNIDFMHATATEREIERNKLKDGDVVFTKDSETAEEIAEASYIYEPPENLVCGYHLAIARPNSNIMNGRFLAAALRFPPVRLQFVRAANGVVRYGLTLEALDEVQVPCPPLPEQRRIAGVLGDWDRAIAQTEALIEAKQKRAKALLEPLVWNHDDPWVPLKGVLQPSRKRVGPNRELPIFSVSRQGLEPQAQRFKKRIANTDLSRHMVVEPGQLALSGLNFWLGSVAINDTEVTICISPDYKVFKLEGAANPSFLKYVVRSAPFFELLVSCATERASVVRKNFNRELFLNSEIPLPCDQEQIKRAEIADGVSRDIAMEERRLGYLQDQKRGLMQKLLSGDMRLSSMEAAE